MRSIKHSEIRKKSIKTRSRSCKAVHKQWVSWKILDFNEEIKKLDNANEGLASASACCLFSSIFFFAQSWLIGLVNVLDKWSPLLVFVTLAYTGSVQPGSAGTACCGGAAAGMHRSDLRNGRTQFPPGTLGAEVRNLQAWVRTLQCRG